MEWEIVSIKDTDHRTWKVLRMKVPGGWLVQSRTTIFDTPVSISESLCFVPDRDHEWILTPEQKP